MYIPGKDLASLGLPFDFAKDSTNSLSFPLSFPLSLMGFDTTAAASSLMERTELFSSARIGGAAFEFAVVVSVIVSVAVVVTIAVSNKNQNHLAEVERRVAMDV